MKLLMFTQPTCAPCKALKPHALAAATELGLELHTVDVWDDPDAARFYEIMSTPALFLVDADGGVLTRLQSRTTLSLMKELAPHL